MLFVEPCLTRWREAGSGSEEKREGCSRSIRGQMDEYILACGYSLPARGRCRRFIQICTRLLRIQRGPVCHKSVMVQLGYSYSLGACYLWSFDESVVRWSGGCTHTNSVTRGPNEAVRGCACSIENDRRQRAWRKRQASGASRPSLAPAPERVASSAVGTSCLCP